MRSLLAAAAMVLLACVAVGDAGAATQTPRANAGPAPGLCAMDTSRGGVPATFPIDACVNGKGVWLRNTMQVPVRFVRSGSLGAPTVTRLANVTTAANVTWLVHGDRNELLMPGQIVFMPLGSNDAAVNVGINTAAAQTYLVIAGVVTLAGSIPGLKNLVSVQTATKLDLLAKLSKELTDVRFNYTNCLAGSKPTIFCEARYKWDVVYAFGRAGVSLAGGAVALAASAVKTWWTTGCLPCNWTGWVPPTERSR